MTNDPVHYLQEREKQEDGTWLEPGWYFWIETWADRYGPYSTEAIARVECARYVKEVLG